MREQANDNPIRCGVAIVAVGILAGILGGGGPAMAAIKRLPDAVIYDGEYPGWPWIDKTPSGTLLTVWREGTEHMHRRDGLFGLHGVRETRPSQIKNIDNAIKTIMVCTITLPRN